MNCIYASVTVCLCSFLSDQQILELRTCHLQTKYNTGVNYSEVQSNILRYEIWFGMWFFTQQMNYGPA